MSNDKSDDSFEYLKMCENVILTPHVAGWTQESNYKLNKVLSEKIKNLIL